ncbi:MAG: glycosyltransferase, partial [Chitinophagaceae bacterium]
MKCSLANPNIAPHIRETLKSYEEHGFLDTFFTSYYFDSHSRLNRFVERYIPSVTKELRRRCIEAIPSERVRSRPLPEFLRVLSSRKFSCKITDQIWEWGELGFDRWVASRLDPTLDWVHTSEHAGLETLKRAKKLGIMSIHEQPSLHHQFFSQIIARQTALYPAFDSGVTQLLYDENSVRRNRRRDAELSLADHILCNSQFTKTTLVNGGVDEAKIITVPLGFPAVQERGERASNDKIRFMYAGNIAFGKGIHLLLEAWREIRSDLIELWLIGNVALPSSLLQDLPDNIRFIPRLPHSELMNTYQSADVFIHPTLADGFGMVIA